MYVWLVPVSLVYLQHCIWQRKASKWWCLESAKVGFGATGRNGGQIVNSYSRDVDVIESRYDQPQAKALCDMIFEGGDIIRGLIDKYDIECDHKRGGLFTALNKKQLAGSRAPQEELGALR